jgi:hypothetical protein
LGNRSICGLGFPPFAAKKSVSNLYLDIIVKAYSFIIIGTDSILMGPCYYFGQYGKIIQRKDDYQNVQKKKKV